MTLALYTTLVIVAALCASLGAVVPCLIAAAGAWTILARVEARRYYRLRG